MKTVTMSKRFFKERLGLPADAQIYDKFVRITQGSDTDPKGVIIEFL